MTGILQLVIVKASIPFYSFKKRAEIFEKNNDLKIEEYEQHNFIQLLTLFVPLNKTSIKSLIHGIRKFSRFCIGQVKRRGGG